MPETVAILLHRDDDVAVVTGAVEVGDELAVVGGGQSLSVTATSPVPPGHKILIRAREAGDRVRKYGEIIGVMTAPALSGSHAHIHNLASLRATRPLEHDGPQPLAAEEPSR